jgi:hypothetical protein
MEMSSNKELDLGLRAIIILNDKQGKLLERENNIELFLF